MTLLKQEKGLYAVTDAENLDDDALITISEILLHAGVRLLQYRDKTNNDIAKISRARALQSLCQHYDCLFIVNDDIELTKNIDADGVHIGKDDDDINSARKQLGDKIIGVSCYNELDRAIHAEQQGADYVAFGAFFPSSIKPDAVRADTALLHEAKQRLTIPIVAIGGITPDNAATLITAGADYLAVISALYHSDKPEQTTEQFLTLFDK